MARKSWTRGLEPGVWARLLPFFRPHVSARRRRENSGLYVVECGRGRAPGSPSSRCEIRYLTPPRYAHAGPPYAVLLRAAAPEQRLDEFKARLGNLSPMEVRTELGSHFRRASLNRILCKQD